MKRTYENQLEKGRILVFGVSGNEMIKQKIAAIYPEGRIAEGISLYNETKSAFEVQNTEQIESAEANRKFNEVQNSLREGLLKIRRAGRYFFKYDAGQSTLLRLNREVPGSYAAWKALANEILSAIETHSSIQEKLTLAELTPGVIAKMRGDLNRVDELRLLAEKEDGQAQQATLKKMELLHCFMAYCSDLKACLDLFYRGNERQRLEEVGIVVK